jgi:urease accessory protein
LFAQIDLAPHVNASLSVMERDAKLMRGSGPTVFTSIKHGTVRQRQPCPSFLFVVLFVFVILLTAGLQTPKGVEDVVDLILAAWRLAGSPGKNEPVGEEE